MNDGKVIERRIRSFVSSVDDSDWDEVVRRAGGSQRTSLTAASARQGSPPLWRHRRRALIALSLAIVIGVPAAAFADDIGSLLGLSNKGTAVATRTLPRDSSLIQNMRGIGRTE